MKQIGVQIRMTGDVADKITEHFGKRLKQWLEERKLGLVDIAEALGISYSYVAVLGKPRPYGRLLSPENAVVLAEFLRIDPDEVFSAMGQINPFLLEKVFELLPVEILERELLNLHKRLRQFCEEASGKATEAEAGGKAARSR